MSKGRGGFPGGMGGIGGMGGNMNQLMQQAQKLQREAEKAHEEIAAMIAEGSAGGGAVKAAVNGEHQVTQLTIDPGVVDPNDVEMLQDLITVAVNDAMNKLEEMSAARMNQVTGGRGMLPGL
jgi:nucleoid-associated protein EbfC